jgi:hypothetical protein
MLDVGEAKAPPAMVEKPDGGCDAQTSDTTPTRESAAKAPTASSVADGDRANKNLTTVNAYTRKAPTKGQKLETYLCNECGWTKTEFDAVQVR